MVTTSYPLMGVLVDFQHAICVENPLTSKGIPIIPVAKRKYLSVDLLTDEAMSHRTAAEAAAKALERGEPVASSSELPSGASLPRALYRHDLESFFYALVFLLVGIRDAEDVHYEFRRIGLDHWLTESVADVRAAKIAFINAGKGAYRSEEDPMEVDTKGVEGAKPKEPEVGALKEDQKLEGIPLVTRWLVPLAALIKSGWDARREFEERQEKGSVPEGETFDEVTLGGHLTYEKFMKVLSPWGDL